MDAADGAEDARATEPVGERARPPRRRSHVARRGFTPWTIGVVVTAVLAGGLFALSAQASAGTSLRTDRADQAALIRRAQANNEETRVRVRALEKENLRAEAQYARADSSLAAVRAAGDALAPRGGFAPVRGTALEVVLDDAPRGQPVPADIPPDYLVVHQQDVQAVVNALWRGGAEAMMLMDQRVISTSAVRCVGNTLILQGRVYSPPYRIRAIGDYARMQSALDSSPEVSVYKQFVNLVQLEYKVSPLGVQTFPTFDGDAQLRYATPLAEAPATTSGGSSPTGTGTSSRTPSGTSSGG
jgi:uncharacterized protein YlxW (UPF0749 family)